VRTMSTDIVPTIFLVDFGFYKIKICCEIFNDISADIDLYMGHVCLNESIFCVYSIRFYWKYFIVVDEKSCQNVSENNLFPLAKSIITNRWLIVFMLIVKTIYLIQIFTQEKFPDKLCKIIVRFYNKKRAYNTSIAPHPYLSWQKFYDFMNNFDILLILTHYIHRYMRT
jgi:hypothetical protein